VGGQAERTREPEIAYAFVRIWPFSLASGLAGYSQNRTPQPKLTQAKEKQNNAISETRNAT
jgi:hypothetical protein